jgi:CRISPR-associated exonuclease Cas4
MTGQAITCGQLYYGKTRRRVLVEFSPELRRLTIEAAARLHALIRSQKTPPADPGPKCDRCSLKALCLPELGRGRSARRAFDRLLDSLVVEVGPEGDSGR